jgi:hypothetical protein
MKFCSSCGKELATDSKFCADCGAATDGNAPQTPNAAVAAATTALGFFTQFVKSPATAIKTSPINQPEAIIYLALVPVSMFLFLYAFVWRTVSETVKLMREGWGSWRGEMPSARSMRSEAFEGLNEFFSFGSAAFETIIHVAVWFVVLVAVPILFFKFIESEEKAAFGNIFPVFAAATIPHTMVYAVSAVITFFHLSAGLMFMMCASMALGYVGFWLLYGTALKRTFNATTEQAVYCSIIAFIMSSMYASFGVWRVAGVFIKDMFGGFF